MQDDPTDGGRPTGHDRAGRVLAYEMTERGETFNSFAHRFFEWPADSPRWWHVQCALALLDRDITGPGPLDDMRVATLRLLDVVEKLAAEGSQVEISVLAEVLSGAATISAAAHGWLDSLVRASHAG